MYSFVFSTDRKNAAFEVRAVSFNLPSAFFFAAFGKAPASRFSKRSSRLTARAYTSAGFPLSREKSAVTIR